MKTSFRFLIAAFALLALDQTPSWAEEKPTANKATKPVVPETFGVNMFPKLNSTKMNLLLENPYGLKLQIKLVNDRNEVVYTETVGRKQTKYWRKFDMSQLKDGRYRFEVSNGIETQSREVDLSTTQPIVPNERLISFRD